MALEEERGNKYNMRDHQTHRSDLTGVLATMEPQATTINYSPFTFGFITLKATGVCWTKMAPGVCRASLLGPPVEQLATSSVTLT